MSPTFTYGTAQYLNVTLQWLKDEDEQFGEGFFCNADIVKKCFLERRAICAVIDAKPVAFAVFYIAAPHSGIEIIQVRRDFRKHGLGRKLVIETLKRLRRRGAAYVNADCTSREGAALCHASGFKPRGIGCSPQTGNVLAQLRYDFPASSQRKRGSRV